MTDYQERPHAIEDPNRDNAVCPLCEEPATTTLVDDTFTYGSGENPVELHARLPVRRCDACDIDFLDYVGERIQTEAVPRRPGVSSEAGRWSRNRATQPALRRRSQRTSRSRKSRRRTVPTGAPSLVGRCVCPRTTTGWVRQLAANSIDHHHHGLLSPWEIRAIRERRKLSRKAFAEITGLGEATIKRWETGATPQNRGNDRYLRTLDTPAGWAELQRIANGEGPSSSVDAPATSSPTKRTSSASVSVSTANP